MHNDVYKIYSGLLASKVIENGSFLAEFSTKENGNF